MRKNIYYDGNKLLSTLDLNGKKPEIFICEGNRTAGKTTYFNSLLLNGFLKRKEKFVVETRFQDGLSNAGEDFFQACDFKYPGLFMSTKVRANKTYADLFLNDTLCGYAIPINTAEKIKRISNKFKDVVSILLDEFQDENNHYCPNEVEKVISIHTSIARGQGKQTRYVRQFFVGNCVTLLNPYYSALGNIGTRIKHDTKYLRGNGWVLEHNYNKHARDAQKQSGFNQAFSGLEYIDYMSENKYLNDNTSLIEKPIGKSKYLCTIFCGGKKYGVWEYFETGTLHCSENYDQSHPSRLFARNADATRNVKSLNSNSYFLDIFRQYFSGGQFTFSSLASKNAIISAISF